MENSFENNSNSNFDVRFIIYLFLFVLLCFFIKSLIFLVPICFLFYKLGELIRYYIDTKQLKKSTQSDLFIYTFANLSLGFYSFLIYKETDSGLNLFSSICFWFSSLTYLFKLITFKPSLKQDSISDND